MAKKRRKRPRDWKEALDQIESPQVIVIPDLKAYMESVNEHVPLLRPLDQEDWTEELRAQLPDGLRWCNAKRIVVNFNYVEEHEVFALNQVLIHRLLYRKWERLTEEEVGAFLICLQKPDPHMLSELRFSASTAAGVYCSDTGMPGESVELIVTEELGPGEHNDIFRGFVAMQLAAAFFSKSPDTTVPFLPNVPYQLEIQQVRVRTELGGETELGEDQV